MNYMEFESFIGKHEKMIHIKDGVYDVTGIEFLPAHENNSDKVIEWLENKDKFWLANAYETDYHILFAEEPKKFEGKRNGSDFNCGSTNILIDCPKNVLILAEND